MGTLIKMKAEVVNHELLVLTEQGILPYYTGVYVNRLADKGVTLTQTEINAVTAFINSLIEADVIDKIGTFYPFMGDVNVPLIGNKELEFSDVTSANTHLDFVNNKLRGVKSFPQMVNVKLSELTDPSFGFCIGGSIITDIPDEDTTFPCQVISFGKAVSSSIPAIQFRIADKAATQTESARKNFSIIDFYGDEESSYTILRFVPNLEFSNNQDNYSFVYGLTNVQPPHETGFMAYNRTLTKNGTILTNSAGSDTVVYIHSENIGENFIKSTGNAYNSVLTTMVMFNEIPIAGVSRAFVNALDTFTAAVGKTVAVE